MPSSWTGSFGMTRKLRDRGRPRRLDCKFGRLQTPLRVSSRIPPPPPSLPSPAPSRRPTAALLAPRQPVPSRARGPARTALCRRRRIRQLALRRALAAAREGTARDSRRSARWAGSRPRPTGGRTTRWSGSCGTCACPSSLPGESARYPSQPAWLSPIRVCAYPLFSQAPDGRHNARLRLRAARLRWRHGRDKSVGRAAGVGAVRLSNASAVCAVDWNAGRGALRRPGGRAPPRAAPRARGGGAGDVRGADASGRLGRCAARCWADRLRRRAGSRRRDACRRAPLPVASAPGVRTSRVFASSPINVAPTSPHSSPDVIAVAVCATMLI